MQRAVRVGAVIGMVAACLIGGGAAMADEPVIQKYPAGVACSFPLQVKTTAAGQPKELPGRNGDSRILWAGKGQAITFTNLDTNATYSLKANGSVQRASFHPNGTSTWEVTGHSVIILYPTDVPAGPSTTLHIGRVLYTSTATSDFTVQQVSGRSVDICAQLT